MRLLIINVLILQIQQAHDEVRAKETEREGGWGHIYIHKKQKFMDEDKRHR